MTLTVSSIQWCTYLHGFSSVQQRKVVQTLTWHRRRGWSHRTCTEKLQPCLPACATVFTTASTFTISTPYQEAAGSQPFVSAGVRYVSSRQWQT